MNITEVDNLLSQEGRRALLYFSIKPRNGGDPYITFSPEVSEDIIGKLIDWSRDFISQYSSLEQISFNPTGYRDGTVEIYNYADVGNMDEVLESMHPGNVEGIGDVVDKFSFYCLDVHVGENKVKLFRRVTKFKKLYSKGLLAAFQGNMLNQMDQKMLGL